MNNNLFLSGSFFTGTNYWASHAGINMWTDWRPEIIEEDFKKLAAYNIRYIRMFPIWSEFQPIREHFGACGDIREIRMREKPLDNTPEGTAGIDPVMIERFDTFLKLAEKYNIGVIVGLLTGWMSGRLFVPEAIVKRNTLTDPFAIKWEIKYVRYMVNKFKSSSAIIAWDLGNECNCMGRAANKNESYTWAATISNAIKREDSTRLVISGMHSLVPGETWNPEDQGEFLDVLCTHPYPLFTPHCSTDPINEMKSVLHATAETRMYEDIGGVPAFAEEMGTLGDIMASRKIASEYIRASLWSLWAHDCKGFMWWCANEQSHLTATPYDWDNVERELGFFDKDGNAKPVLEEISKFTKFVDSFGTLPEMIRDAVCILTPGQDKWAAAYGTFALAKKAGIDVTFAYAELNIPDSDFYIIPSINSTSAIYNNKFKPILKRVANGATLYISLADAVMSSFKSYTGIEPQTRCAPVCADTVTLGDCTFSLTPSVKYNFKVDGAKVLACDSDNNPVMTVNDYGKGKVYVLAYPIEDIAARSPRVISGEFEKGYHKFYEVMAGSKNKNKVAATDSTSVGMTEHIIDGSRRALVFVNYTPREETSNITLIGYKFVKLENAEACSVTPVKDGFTLELSPNNGAVAIIEKI